jgi:hypothetical protein
MAIVVQLYRHLELPAFQLVPRSVAGCPWPVESSEGAGALFSVVNGKGVWPEYSLIRHGFPTAEAAAV